MSKRIAAMQTRFNEARRQSIIEARRISSIMRAAGMTKAGRYQTFGGYEPDGYIVGQAGNGTVGIQAVAIFTASNRPVAAATAEKERARAKVIEAGYEIIEETKNSFHATPSN